MMQGWSCIGVASAVIPASLGESGGKALKSLAPRWRGNDRTGDGARPAAPRTPAAAAGIPGGLMTADQTQG